ncbi:TetR/AcrR family transcriptional regulator [Nonomuraea gerenzanensis]|uniref:Transcriptional regulator, TetR family n=1 Tax=Nonomuraea gerenzanensis TaxID=93944 RepID=A0A1M4EPZ2_9ACTN|nr:TetR/AcrR family transcriptional regulator [Nonomuraea gerenzanensis]UBU12331.1 TetR/AcrR family transcriptional regulator [Nonomuraea gerenzanensis]SBP00875.1 Transcriptional regulator, TetR family [Nonomuraea gerenzanensis]
MRRGYATGAARRERILATALLEFAEHGYRGASLARIAERAELSQAGLLHHFRTKELLLVAVLDYRDELDARTFDLEPASGIDALTTLVRVVEHNSRMPGLVQLFSVISGEAVTPGHPGHDWARRRYRRLRAMVAGALRRGAERGELRAGLDAEAHADRLIAMMDGLQTQWLIDPDQVDMAAVFQGYVDDLIATLRP